MSVKHTDDGLRAALEQPGNNAHQSIGRSLTQASMVRCVYIGVYQLQYLAKTQPVAPVLLDFGCNASQTSCYSAAALQGGLLKQKATAPAIAPAPFLASQVVPVGGSQGATPPSPSSLLQWWQPGPSSRSTRQRD